MTGFDEARRAALIGDLLRLVRRQPLDLLPFDLVRERFHLKHFRDRGFHEVPLARIAGTLGREREFSRAFLPRDESLRERWEEVRDLALGPSGFPAVELYQVGDAYFVVDGHHRISVARSMRLETIEAHVKEFVSPVALGANDSVEDVVLGGALADFLEATQIDPQSGTDLRLTDPKGYERLLDHIGVHRYFMGIEQSRSIPWSEAVASWRDTVFQPMVGVIRKSGVMESFEGCTDADLYLYFMDHLHHLRERYGSREVRPEVAVRHFEFTLLRERSPWERLKTWWRSRRSREPGG